MSYKYGKASLEKRATLHPKLQEIVDELIKVMDVSIICGHRNEQDQNKAFSEGNSKLQYPMSKHNKLPSLAVDIVPYPIDWEDREAFARMNGVIEGIALMKGIKIRLGRDFSFSDRVHIELDE